MSEPIAPALAPAEWQPIAGRVIHEGDGVGIDVWGGDGDVVIWNRRDPAAPPPIISLPRDKVITLALLNASLLDNSPYKLRSRHVAALTNIVAGYRDPEDLAVLDELATILVALLPPQPTP